MSRLTEPSLAARCLAWVRLFLGVHVIVFLKTVLRTEAFLAARTLARERPFIRVTSIVSLKMALPRKALDVKSADILT